VQVHFDCRFRGIDAVSSRYARTLGGNRTIAEVRREHLLAAAAAAAAKEHKLAAAVIPAAWPSCCYHRDTQQLLSKQPAARAGWQACTAEQGSRQPALPCPPLQLTSVYALSMRCRHCLPLSSNPQPLEFTAGQQVNLYAKKMNDTAGGLFAGGSGPKPPPAISTAVIGMKPGGRVRPAAACVERLLLCAAH
jgi:peptidylprolyl isomerase